jgi:hypothetical protein
MTRGVYRGCKPRCDLIGGPFALRHGPSYGHLDANGTFLATASHHYVDVCVQSVSLDTFTACE